MSGRLVARFGSAGVLLAGLLTAAAGFVPLLFLSADGSAALVVIGTALVGCGIGAMAPPVTAVIMNDVGTEKAGDGAAVNQVARQVGGALGVAIVGSVFAAVYSAQISADGVPAWRRSRSRTRRKCQPTARRGPCRPSRRRRRELRRGSPMGPCRLHGGRPPRGGERGRRAVTDIPGRVTIRLNGEMGALRLRGQTARATRGRDLH